MQEILRLDEAKFGLLNHSAVVCGGRGVLPEFTGLALLNLLQLRPIKKWRALFPGPRAGAGWWGSHGKVVLCRDARTGCRVLWRDPGGGILFHDVKVIKAQLVWVLGGRWIIFFFFLIFVHVTALGLSCIMWDLLSRDLDSLVVVGSMACGILVP